MANALSAERLSKTFRLKTGQTLTALDAVSFTVPLGGITALVGPDGAGKSTLLRIVAGLLKPDSGKLLFGSGIWGAENKDLREQIGYMPQKFGLYEDLTVQENMDLYADLRGVSAKDRKTRYMELLAMAGLEPFRQRAAGKLSGGMKQKLALTCTLVSPPKLLLLDEPTVGVDPLSRRELWEIIKKLSADSGMSVIISTSYMDEASRCDEVVLLFEGKTLTKGSPESIKKLTDGMAYMARPAARDLPRTLQSRMLGAPGVIDAVPQGGAVRFVRGGLSPEQAQTLGKTLRGAEVHKVSSSLEDSFMLLLSEHVQGTQGEHVQGTLEPEQADSAEYALSSPSVPPPGNMPPDEPVIQTKNVSRLFGDFTAVDNISFSVRRGEVFGLLGPNGAGKTTTFRMLCGLLPASKGSLHVAGVDVRKAREQARRRLGYVAQKFSLYGPLSVRENLDFFAGAYGLRGKRKSGRIQAVTAEFALARQLAVPAENLPGGYKQRLAMAVGLLHEPDILFLDEPTSGADPLARRSFWKRISRLAANGVTIVVTTHFMEEAEYCDRILIQDSGVMLALGTPEEIKRQADAPPGGETSMEDAFINIVAKARAKKQEATA